MNVGTKKGLERLQAAITFIGATDVEVRELQTFQAMVHNDWLAGSSEDLEDVVYSLAET